jgi:hypothetical protein
MICFDIDIAPVGKGAERMFRRVNTSAGTISAEAASIIKEQIV